MWILLWLALAIAVGAWAQRIGRDGLVWGLLAIAISPIVAGLVLLAVGENQEEVERIRLHNGMIKCPACAELIKAEAVKCRYCGQLVADAAHGMPNDEEENMETAALAERFARAGNRSRISRN